MKARAVLAVACLLAPMALPTPAAAVNDSTATATPLDATHSTVSDQLTGK